jgi:transcriptional regulator with XRE-family HTH domain
MATDDSPRYQHYLKEWRERRGMMQADLARLARTDATTISRYETGDRRIHLEMQFKLMAALRITPAQFFSHPDSPSLDALASKATPEDLVRISNVVKALLPRDDD